MRKLYKNRKLRMLLTASAVLFWLLIWQMISMLIENKFLIASPTETIKAFHRLCLQSAFWVSVGTSFLRIAAGFFLAVFTGTLFAVLSSLFHPVKTLLNPVVQLIKAVPVASFIILALLWVSSRSLSTLISFLMVFPVIYTNVLNGMEATREELLEMAEVFRLSFWKKLRMIYVPSVLPYFVSACSVGLGFSFKSGIAAEVIGLPKNSIGEKLYQAKLTIQTDELFAWTAVIVLVSLCFEKAVRLLLSQMMKRLFKTGLYRKRKPSTRYATKKEENKRQGKTVSKREEYGLVEVDKAFDGKQVLTKATITFQEGERVAFMGPSGSGKSTTGKLLLGILAPDAGLVKRPLCVSAVFQEDRLCKEFDAVTNISAVTRNAQEATEALKELRLEEAIGKPVDTLSGGMKRRVAIARALLYPSELIVLDEPFTGLDEEARGITIQFIKKRLNNRTLFLITHHEEEAILLTSRVISCPEVTDAN